MIPTPCRSPAGRLRRCARPAPTARRCPRRSPAPPPPARRGYGYGSGSAVVDGTAGVPVRACQGSYAPVQAIGVVRQTGRATGARARHKTRNTTDIRESCARLGVSRPTENGAFRCFKKAAPFSVARGAIFHNLLKRQKIAPVLTRRARAAQSGIGCVARLNRTYRCSTACLAGTGKLAPNARTESRAARG